MLLGLMAAAVVTATCTMDRSGYCTDTIVQHTLTYDRPQSVVKINAALGDVVSISFPEDVELNGEPALGNSAIFAFRAQKGGDALRVLVWPKYPPGARDLQEADLIGGRTNLQVFLDSGLTVQVELKIAKKQHAVSQVRLVFPDRIAESQFLREQLAEQARRLQRAHDEERASIEASVTDRVEHQMAAAVLKRHHCEQLNERAMRGYLIVHARRICRIGDRVFVELSIKNRARGDLFHFDRLEVHDADGVSGNPGRGFGSGGGLDARVVFERDPVLGFGQTVLAVAVFSVAPDDGDASREYAVTVVESGGKKRVVTVDDIEF